MFKSQNFCHIASNNRNQVKVGVFVYRTTDDLATVLTSGYFNDRIIDINLHDLIIHEKVDSADATKVQRNLLCVTGRTLENVSTSIIKSKWEGDIEQAIADLQTYIDNNFVKLDGTSVMTGPLKFRAGSMRGAIAPYLNGVSFWKMDSEGNITNIANLTDSQFLPVTTNSIDIGRTANAWKDAYVARVITSVINNGFDIAVPVTNSADTLALKSQVDDAANSGEQLYTTGVWYAKMYAATTVPTGAEYEGRNYADFSQVDGNNDPIIVVYTYTSGTWTLTETINPPKNHNGYMTITSKIWDIAEQAGQQGGLVLWSHNQETFTPYPRIVSFESINITGNSTVVMPANPTDNSIPNKKYVDDAVSGAHYHPELLSWQWYDHEISDMQWLEADTFSWQDGTVYEQAYDHLVDDIDGKTLQSETIAGTTVQFYLADDGHKVCPATEESNVSAIYTAAGAAWYYILDTANQRFKLPRVNPDEEKLVSYGTVPVYATATVNPQNASESTVLWRPAGTTSGVTGGHRLGTQNDNGTLVETSGIGGVQEGNVTISNLQATLSGATSYYKGNKYLYFYVGSFTQSAIENTAGLNASLFNGKADTDLGNVSAGIDFVVETQLPTAQNNYTWYRKYKSGWVEQGGVSVYTSAADYTVSMPVEMNNVNYTILVTLAPLDSPSTSADVGVQRFVPFNLTTTSFKLRGDTLAQLQRHCWQVSGMAA